MKKPTNKFGMGCYYHIETVVKIQNYCQKYNADQEVIMIAAWLHDIALITYYSLYEKHHIHGSQMAYDILSELHYDDRKTALVKKCIEKNSKEELCFVDSISRLDSVLSLLYLAYSQNKIRITEGIESVHDKLERSFNKLSSENKNIYNNKYAKVMEKCVYVLK